MNCLSINNRGFGAHNAGIKVLWVKHLCREEKIDFLVMQELQISGFKDKDVGNYWGSKLFKMVSIDSSGRSGGLSSVWNSEVFEAINVFSDPHFIAVDDTLKGSNFRLSVMNVYAPHSISERKVLWAKILAVMYQSGGEWILIGDFNAVRFIEDRRNSRFDPVCARSFNDFINEAELISPVMVKI